VSAPTHIPIREAARRLGLTYRRTRQLIADGKLRAIESADSSDGRIRWLVSARSVAYHKRARNRLA
jgi:hypothetical protein